MGLFGSLGKLPSDPRMNSLMQAGTLAPETQSAVNQFASMPVQKKPGFNEPGGWGEKLAMIGAMLGGSPIPMQMRMMQQQREMQGQQAQMDRQAKFEDWQRQYDYEMAHPKPINNDTVNDFTWYKGLSPEDRALYDQFRPVTVMGPDGQYAIPRTSFGNMGGGIPTAPVGKLTPIDGGPTPAASGGFRPRF